MPAGAKARVSRNVYWTIEIVRAYAPYLLGTGVFLPDICSIGGFDAFVSLLLHLDQQTQVV